MNLGMIIHGFFGFIFGAIIIYCVILTSKANEMFKITGDPAFCEIVWKCRLIASLLFVWFTLSSIIEVLIA